MHFTPIFACGHMEFPGWLVALACLFLASWLATIVLALVNPHLISSTPLDPGKRRLHYIFYGFYMGWVLLLFTMPTAAPVMFGAVGIPLCAILHYITLLSIRRKIRKASVIWKRTAPQERDASDYRV